MGINYNNPIVMKDYLKYALEFEKYVYIWSRAMDEANCRMRQIYSERKRLKNAKETTGTQLASLNDTNQRQQRYKESEAARYRKKSKNTLVTTAVLLTLLFLIGVGIGYALLTDTNTTFVIPRSAVIPVLGLTVMIVGSIFTGILPICLGIFFSNKRKAAQFEKEAKELAGHASVRRQEMILQTRQSEMENNWIVNNVEESVVSKRQEEIQNALINAKNNLLQIYSENVLPQKYRSLTAVATLYEYLETGRCNTVQGHGGIYDTYEVEKIHLEQLFRIILVMGRNGAFRIHHILSADLSIVADIFAQREVVEVEGQIDEILLGGVFQLGDADKELIVFVVVEALHPPGEVVQLVQIGEAVFQHGEFLRPVDLCQIPLENTKQMPSYSKIQRHLLLT